MAARGRGRTTTTMIFHYIRHGLPIYNPDQLTPAGHLQAAAVAKRLARFGVDRIFSSNSNRAIETARPTSELCGREIEILDWCNEGHAWQCTARPSGKGWTSWVFCNPAYMRKFSLPEVLALGDLWYTHPLFADDHFQEGFETIAREVDGLFASLGYVHDRETHTFKAEKDNDNRIALFAHEGMGAMFLSSLLDIPYPIFSTRFDLTHTGLVSLEFRSVEDGRFIPTVLTYGNDSHLYAENLPTKFMGRVNI